MIHTFAAIYIGSYEVSIKIFEISGKKKIRDIDYIRSRIELGRDAYSKGSIGYELVEALCDTLAEYKKIMDGYRVDSYEAYAAAALRNAENELSDAETAKQKYLKLYHCNSSYLFLIPDCKLMIPSKTVTV